MLPLIVELFATAGWPRSSLDRVAVGIGPGSFVGLRVGIALAEGLGIGLDRPVVGVPSLNAMAGAVPPEREGDRVALVDARRAEVFVSVVDSAGSERLAARAVARSQVRNLLEGMGPNLVLIGEVAAELDLPFPVLRGAELDLPHANQIARLGRYLECETSPPVPCYVRGPGATLPNLPPSPFAEPHR